MCVCVCVCVFMLKKYIIPEKCAMKTKEQNY